MIIFFYEMLVRDSTGAYVQNNVIRVGLVRFCWQFGDTHVDSPAVQYHIAKQMAGMCEKTRKQRG